MSPISGFLQEGRYSTYRFSAILKSDFLFFLWFRDFVLALGGKRPRIKWEPPYVFLDFTVELFVDYIWTACHHAITVYSVPDIILD